MDCKNHRLKYNKIFSTVPEELCSSNKKDIKQEVFFIGTDKGRIDKILQVKQELDKLCISNKINCVRNGNSPNTIIHPPHAQFCCGDFYSDPISYRDVLVEDTQSKAILDINNGDRHGMTMRELEALFLHKKLITNNTKVKKRDFYDKNNVFIIDYSKSSILDGLKGFRKKPVVPVNREIIGSYSFNSWLKRFQA
jgi:hypothetical protein